MIINAVQQESEMHLVCDREFTIVHATEIKETLLQSMQRSGDEVLSLSLATAIDVSGIQLAWAWKHALATQGRKATIILPEEAGIKDLLTKTGITQIL